MVLEGVRGRCEEDEHDNTLYGILREVVKIVETNIYLVLICCFVLTVFR